MCGHGLKALPYEVLFAIGASLPFKDRLAFFSCCPATRAVHKAQRLHPVPGTPVLWPELSLSVRDAGKARHLAAWLAYNRNQLGSLQVYCWPDHVPPTPTKSAAEEANTELFQDIMLLLGVLAGSTVHSLLLHNTEVRVGSWLGTLPQLRNLRIKGGKVTITSSLSQLQGLTNLSLGLSRDECPLDPDYLSVPQHCLPTTLQALSLRCFDDGTLPLVGMPELPHLCSLDLESPENSSLQLGWLKAYPQLTALRLRDWDLGAVPVELTALTSLVSLTLDNVGLDSCEDDLAPLPALDQLTKLSLRGNSLEWVPPAVLSLPALQELDISSNLIKEELLLSSSTVTSLVLDDSAAIISASQLTGLVALRKLRLTEEDIEDGRIMSCQDAMNILRGINALPHFEFLDAEQMFGDPSPFFVASKVLEALGMQKFRILGQHSYR